MSRKLTESIATGVMVLAPYQNLVFVSRRGSGAMTNENLIGKDLELLNECDVVFGVHGAALTHFMFMKPSFVFIQIVSLGIHWIQNSS
ncbi:glycosyltransferase family 61 protein [Medicago truncatula]|uniref:Glycosyltransferase family 61 protein n=1 Tax=Medicago truncatula TaxID=3880 RepID=G7KTG7_MEDTR|nr:glycosyltransferase family 61 protein [Medicago truncatula]